MNIPALFWSLVATSFVVEVIWFVRLGQEWKDLNAVMKEEIEYRAKFLRAMAELFDELERPQPTVPAKTKKTVN